jgi:predicted AAA+ superfamily ATPase
MTIQNRNQLETFSRLGASWEGFALESVCRMIEPYGASVNFWSTHQNAEVDLFWQWGGKNRAVEFKYMDAPKTTKSMRMALDDLDLEHLWIVYPGKELYPLDQRITVMPLNQINKDLFLT